MSRIKITPLSQITMGSEPQFLVQGLIPARDITIVWGKPKSGKTFWVLDLALHVASGKDYRGRRVEAGHVVYCALEGGAAFPNRLEALRRAGTVAMEKDSFWLTTDRFTFLRIGKTGTVGGAGDLIRAIKETLPEFPKLVIIDTLNRSLHGSENTDADMSEYIGCVEDISETFDCCTIIIHHCGVSGDKPRGHTSLTGTCAAQLKVARVSKSADLDQPAMISTMIEHMKDGQEGQQIFSWLQPIALGINRAGQEITSCYITEAPSSASQKRPRFGTSHTEKALAILQTAISESEEQRVLVGDWREKCRSAKMGKTKEAAKQAFYRAVERLQLEGVIRMDGQHVSLTQQEEKYNGSTKEPSGAGGENHPLGGGQE